jgi:hypothetical protein
MLLVKKTFQYQTIIIDDRGHLNDPEFLEALNKWGELGWKHKEEQPIGSMRLAVLLEREVILDTPKEVSDD